MSSESSSSDLINSPLWNYAASGVKYILKKEILKMEGLLPLNDFKVIDGVKMNLIVSMASVIEGSLRDYLYSEIRNLILKKEKLEEIISKNEINKTDKKNPYSNSINVESNFVIYSDEDPITTLNEINFRIDQIISKYDNYFNELRNQKCNFSIKLFTLADKYSISESQLEKLQVVLNTLEWLEWKKLKHHFKKITTKDFFKVLNSENDKLFEDIEMIFKFRNFIVHSNFIKINLELDSPPHFDQKCKDLMDYIDSRKLTYNGPEDHPFFIESLFTDKLLIHFDKCLDLFLKIKLFRESPNIITELNFIWR